MFCNFQIVGNFLTARYLVHYGSWGIFSAISPDFGYVPFGTVQSFADGPMGNSTGSPYFYIASVSDTYKNMEYNNSVSLTVSQAESDYCEKERLDPEEPICSRVTVTGQASMQCINIDIGSFPCVIWGWCT